MNTPRDSYHDDSSPTAASSNALDALRIDRSAAPRSGRKPRRRALWVALAIGVVVVGAGVSRLIVQRATPVEIATIATVVPTQALTTLNATGRVVAQRRAAVSSKGSGRLEVLNVQEGQAVKEGEVLARLENKDVAAQRDQAAAGVRQARANLEQGVAELNDAQANLERQQDLARQGFVSASAVDTALARAAKARASIASYRAAIGVAEANLRVAEVAFEQTLIRAPFDGVVLTKNANVGDILTPFSAAAGTTGAVVTMADMRTLEVEADVSESSISKISAEQPAEIQLDAYPALRLLGKVNRIVPTVDRSKATLLVKVAFVEKDPRVLPDMSAKIAFLSRVPTPEERQPVIAVRPQAVVQREGRNVVLAVGQDDRVTIKPVTMSERIGDLVRVDGVATGERVVIAPPATLRDGARVVAQAK
ncbi:MAG TPA: efflux RND transporter periplasmic adaptor subunit [Burkholderiaceae bacterium]|nr:efflux RND transporter periplasmic adaptor subunit [Burkholderiaceae bacterium]